MSRSRTDGRRKRERDEKNALRHRQAWRCGTSGLKGVQSGRVAAQGEIAPRIESSAGAGRERGRTDRFHRAPSELRHKKRGAHNEDLFRQVAPDAASPGSGDIGPFGALAPCSGGGFDRGAISPLRSNSPRLTPFRPLSRSASLAVPESVFFIALTLAPPVCTSSATCRPALQKIVC